MKKLKWLFLLLYVSTGYAQYINPIVQCPTTSSSRDGSVEIQIVGGKPPLSYIEWYDRNGYQNSSAFHVERISELNSPVRVTVMDSLCRLFEAVFYIYHTPARQIQIDTIITIMPTPGNSDGSIEIQFDQFPAGYIKSFGPRNGAGSITNSTLFTGLADNIYQFNVQDPNNSFVCLELSIPMTAGDFPCDHFDVSTVGDMPSPYPSTGCDASLTVNGSGPPAGDYWAYLAYYFTGGGSDIAHWWDEYRLDYDYLCRTLYRLYMYNDESKFAYHHCYFLPDSADTHYTWNIPTPVPGGTDTLHLQTVSDCDIDPTDAIDTVYLNNYMPLGNGQFELEFALKQNSDTFYVYNAAVLDSATFYCFDFIVHCDVDMDYPYEDHSRHFIYFEPLNTRSLFYTIAPSEPVFPQVRIYPNPFNDRLCLNASGKITKAELFTISGAHLDTWNINQQRYETTMEQYEPGIYLLKIYDETGRATTRKITKMK